MNKYIANFAVVVLRKRVLVLFSLLLILSIFLRFYQLDERAHFKWDEVNNAWVAKNIIVEHEYPLVGFQAKLNSGIYIGPIYYYLISVFYFFTNLDPIASGIFAGVTSIFTFLTIFLITKKLFSFKVAFIVIFFNTVCFYSIIFDRTQGPINFVPAISLIIFYSLYKIMTGNPKFFLLFTIAFGFSLHLHITAIYFPIITLFCLPFFPWTKKLLKYIILGIPILLFFIFPGFIAFSQNYGYAFTAISYGNSYFHGLHLTRIMQLANDALIQFESYFDYSSFKHLKFILIPLFVFFFLYKIATLAQYAYGITQCAFVSRQVSHLLEFLHYHFLCMIISTMLLYLKLQDILLYQYHLRTPLLVWLSGGSRQEYIPFYIQVSTDILKQFQVLYHPRLNIQHSLFL